MTAFLLITLAAPLASFGEQAGNARRSSAERPTKSALIGLLGAALGVERADEAGQRALASGYKIATRSWRFGTILQDFHTYQSLPRPHSAATRADALAQKDLLETSITVREYRQDVFHEAAYVAEAGARWSLEELAKALRRPRFTLSLGRKSCPLAWPLIPKIETADHVGQAFDAYARQRAEMAADGGPDLERLLRRRASPSSLAVEERDWLTPRNAVERTHRRFDQPADRVRWHFEPRYEHVVSVDAEESDR